MNAKSIIILGVCVMPFLGCTNSEKEDIFEEDADVQQPVSFSSFIQSDKTVHAAKGVTRADGDETTGTGTTDVSADLKTLRSKGFGVFAVNTSTGTYQDWRTANSNSKKADAKFIPDFNFMKNQEVKWTEGTEGANGSWSYSPIKYWPNPTRGQDKDDCRQNVSFFAYAPYQQSMHVYNPSSSTTNSSKGILGYGYADNGDALIAYDISSGVDLLWGTSGGSDNGCYFENSSNTTNLGKAYNNDGEDGTQGAVKVNADIAKMKTGGKLQFNFKHALSKFNITADTKVGSNTASVDDNSKVMIDYVVMAMENSDASENDKKILNVGYLNLATGTFQAIKNASGSGEASGTSTDKLVNAVTAGGKAETLPDGITDDSPATLNTALATTSAEAIKTAAEGTGSSAKMQTRGNDEPATRAWSDLPSVTNEPKDVVQDGHGFMIIPDFTPKVTVYVKYHIYTKDPNYASLNGYVDVSQISKAEVTMNQLEGGRAYTLALHLGLTNVEMTAKATDWETTDTNADLPENVK